MIYKLYKSTRPDKKWVVITPWENKIYFGQQGASDYTIHKDEKRRMNYISRHKSREDWNDLSTPGAWSFNLLWSYPTLNEAIKNMERRFGIKIQLY